MRLAAIAVLLLLGGCSLAGNLHLGDVTLALHQGFHAFGSHVAIARVALGKANPSPKPSASRSANKEASPPTSPVSIVATVTSAPQNSSVRRVPKRSLIHPPNSWISA